MWAARWRDRLGFVPTDRGGNGDAERHMAAGGRCTGAVVVSGGELRGDAVGRDRPGSACYALVARGGRNVPGGRRWAGSRTDRTSGGDPRQPRRLGVFWGVFPAGPADPLRQ